MGLFCFLLIFIDKYIMAKLKITKEQYNRILIREQQARLKASSNVLNENLSTNPELLEEGLRDVVLGVAMMLGIGLTGQNEVIAQDAVKNETTMAQIKATLEDEGKVEELANQLEESGMKNANEKLADNAEQVMDQFNEIAKDNKIKYKVDIKVVTNLQGLKGKLNQGYALKNAEMSTDTVKSNQEKPNVLITDTMEINLGSDNLFVTGGFTLSPAGVDTIKMSIESIIAQGGKIQSVEVESSTDAERIDPDGPLGSVLKLPRTKSEANMTEKELTEEALNANLKLANLRTQSVTNLLASLGVEGNVTHKEIASNGREEVSTVAFFKARKNPVLTKQLREKTSEFRYVKLKIVATFDIPDTTANVDVPKLVQHYRFELVKVTESTGTVRKIKTSTHFKQKKFKCKKPKGDHSPIKCSFQR